MQHKSYRNTIKPEQPGLSLHLLLLCSFCTSAFWRDFRNQVLHRDVLQALFFDHIWTKWCMTSEMRFQGRTVKRPTRGVANTVPLQCAFSWSFQPHSTSFALSSSFNLRTHKLVDTARYQAAGDTDSVPGRGSLTAPARPFLSASG